MAAAEIQGSTALDRIIYTSFGDNEETVLKYFACFTIVWSSVVCLMLVTVDKARYGRYGDKSASCVSLRNNIVLMLTMMPSFWLPLILAFFTEAKQLDTGANVVCLAMYTVHYFHRSFIYSTSIRGGTPVPWQFVIFSTIFVTCNGYVQGRYHTQYSMLGKGWITDPRFIIGSFLFVLGMAINIQSDHLLINLRKPGDTTYRIPTGGLFKYVSAANYFGECVEWIGYALVSWSLPAFSLAFATICNIGPRAFHHHQYYHQKFEDYPKDRKAFIPFVI